MEKVKRFSYSGISFEMFRKCVICIARKLAQDSVIYDWRN